MMIMMKRMAENCMFQFLLKRWAVNSRHISVSYTHLIRRGQDFFIKDNNSKNHTYVNGRMVVGEELVQLKAGDTITLANEVFEYHEILSLIHI